MSSMHAQIDREKDRAANDVATLALVSAALTTHGYDNEVRNGKIEFEDDLGRKIELTVVTVPKE